jgi:hypothetical protein
MPHTKTAMYDILACTAVSPWHMALYGYAITF